MFHDMICLTDIDGFLTAAILNQASPQFGFKGLFVKHASSCPKRSQIFFKHRNKSNGMMFFSLVRPWVSMEDRLTTRYPIVFSIRYTRALMKLHAILQGYAFWLFLTSRHLMFAPWSLVLLLKEVLLVPKCRCLDCLWALPFHADEIHSHQIYIDAAGSA